jgi:uncharacterized repeat protein (TIGR01451 family)
MNVMKRIALAVTICLASAALAQQDIDYSISLSSGGTAYPEATFVVAMQAHASYGMAEEQPFVARLTVPPGLTVGTACGGGNSDGEGSFDPATRVFTWSGRFNDSAPSGEKNCPLTMVVERSVQPGTLLLFDAAVTTPFTETNLNNNAASMMVAVVAATDLAAIASSSAQRLRTGDTLTFTAGVTNLGALDATNVTLTNQLSPHVTFLAFEQLTGPGASLDAAPRGDRLLDARIPVLAAGATATFRVSVHAHETADILHSVRVRAPLFDPFENNNVTYTGAFAGPNADLGLLSSRVPAGAGTRVPINLVVTNNGPDPVDNVGVSNILYDSSDSWDREEVKYASVVPSQGSCTTPELTQPFLCPPIPGYWAFDCALGTLAPGGRATIRIVVERGAYRGPLEHVATVGPAQNDPNQRNNELTVDLAKPRGRRRALRIR